MPKSLRFSLMVLAGTLFLLASAPGLGYQVPLLFV
jgi:hypothetical protein